MRARRIPALLVLAILLAPSGARGGEETPEAAGDVRTAVARWLGELHSDEYAVREAARAGLEARGLEARDLLEAARDDVDAEVRRTVRAILERAPAGGSPAMAFVTPGDFGRLGLLSLDWRGVTAHEAAARLGQALGARFLLPEDAGEARHDVLLAERPCFEAIDRVLGTFDLRMAEGLDGNGTAAIVRRTEDDEDPPLAAVGPACLTVGEVSATRTFGAPGALPRYAVKLDLAWAPFVHVAQYRTPVVDVARDPHGLAFRPTSAMGRTVSYGIGKNTSRHAFHVHLEPESEACEEHLAVLELTVPVRLWHERVTVDVTGLADLPVAVGPDGKPAKAGTADSVQVISVREAEGGQGAWTVDYVATLPDETAQSSFAAWVVEADGSLARLLVYGGRTRSADGTLRDTARVRRRDRDGPPPALRFTWFRREEEGVFHFRIEDVPLR